MDHTRSHNPKISSSGVLLDAIDPNIKENSTEKVLKMPKKLLIFQK